MSDKDERKTLQFGDGGDGGGGDQPDWLMEQRPETIRQALGRQGKSMSIAKAAEANPYYSEDYNSYSENCQRCIVAYEERRRGYDVIAQPTYKNDKWSRAGQNRDRWRGAFRHAKTDSVGASNPDKALQNIQNKMREYGNGARAVIGVSWKKGHTGHVFICENQNGRIVFIEPQRTTWKQSHRYTMKDMKSMFRHTNTSQTELTRVDNLQTSYRVKEFVEQRKRR